MNAPAFFAVILVPWTEWAWFVLGFTLPICVAIVVAAVIIRSRL